MNLKLSILNSAGTVTYASEDGDPKVPFTTDPGGVTPNLNYDHNLRVWLTSGTTYVMKVEGHGNYGDRGQYVVELIFWEQLQPINGNRKISARAVSLGSRISIQESSPLLDLDLISMALPKIEGIFFIKFFKGNGEDYCTRCRDSEFQRRLVRHRHHDA